MTRRLEGTMRCFAAKAAAVLLTVVTLAGCNEPEYHTVATGLMIPMSQGGALAADVYPPPRGDGPWPAILLQIPYGKSLWDATRLPLDSDLNYAYVLVDRRGRGDSSEALDPDAEPGIDGYDCVEWIAAQPWSDGHIATWGTSALGLIQYKTAREKPPHLDAIVPLAAGPWEHFTKYYPGGVQREDYLRTLVTLGFFHGPLVKVNPSRAPLISKHYWQDLEGESDYGAELEVPALLIGGWYDHATERLVRAFNQMPNPTKRLVMGPWTHNGIDQGRSGDLGFAQAEHFATHATRSFLDFHLRGVGSGLSEGPVWWYEMGAKRWHTGASWPPPGTSTSRFYLTAGGGLGDAPSSAGSESSTYT